MIAIRHLTGPLAGQTQSFDDGKEKIEFGRESDCDVVYPAEETLVGRRHLALVRDLNDWVVHLHEGSQGAHYVGIEPALAGPGLPIESGSIFHLGNDTGPSFDVTFDQSALAGDLRQTVSQEKVTLAPQLFRRLAIGGGLVAALLAVAFGWSTAQNMRRDHELAATVASLAVDQKNDRNALAHMSAAAAASIDQNIINRMRKATFLVVEEDAQGRKFGMGTAWAIGPDVLATNAHIAGICDDTFPIADRSMAECNELKPGERMLVVQPGPGGASYRVIGHSYHPGYTALPKFVMGEDPAFIASFRGAAPSQVTGFGYDVGLLRIDGQLPPELALQVASEAELLALEPGMPLASSGYPYENVAGQDAITVAATPQIHYGNISALTDFLFLPTTPAHSYLVQHSIPETGGGSGSLIVGASGHIVAINNAGTFGPKGEGFSRGAPSGVLINYAQRADIIADLHAGRAQSAFDADKPYWSKQLANFKRGVDVIGDWVLEHAKPDEKSVAQLVSTTTGALGDSDMRVNPDTKKKQRVKVETIDASAGLDYFAFVYADRKTPIAIYLKDADNQTLASNTNSGWYPSLSFKPTHSGPLSLIVVGPDDDTAFTTKIYTWRHPGS
jgi:hypothetical protein